MQRHWTDEQLTAIDTTGKNLLVSASAGSGKTAVLVERILRLIKTKQLQTDEILAITFTKAAAGELKQRIRNTLKETMNSLEGEEAEYFALQAEKLDSANISTLHSFCYSIIKKYYHLISIDPQVRIMRDEEQSILSLDAVDDVFEEYYEKEDNFFIEFIDTFSSGGDDSMIKENIISSYEQLRNLADYEERLKEFVRDYPENEEMFSSSEAVRFIMEESGEIIREAKIKYEKAIEIARSGEDGDKRPITDNLCEMVEVLDFLEMKRNISFKEFLGAVHSSSMPRAKTPKNLAGKDEIEKYRTSGKAIYDDLKKYVPFDFETALYYTVSMKTYVEKFAEVLMRYEEILSEKKRDKKMVDYSDLEHLCLKVLKDDNAREEIRSSFRQVLTDEYQDINGVQEAIISNLSTEDDLFMVGDIKQSIYRFRQADPGIFSEKYIRYKDAGENDKNMLVHLNRNFRSSKTIIDFVNMLFSAVMTKKTGGVDFYPDEVMKAAHPVLIDEPVHLRIIDTSGYVGEEMENNREAEAVYVAELIKNEILAKTYKDEVTGQSINFSPSDIAVIDRSMKAKASYFIKAFEQAGLSCDIAENSKYYDAFEVSLIINLLRIIDNEYNDIALLSVMRSFIYNFTEDDLSEIRAFGKDCMYYHQAAEKYLVEGSDASITSKLGKLYSDAARYRSLSRHISLRELIETIYEENHILPFIGAMPDGDKRTENLRELTEIASEYESSHIKGLYDFILYADKCRENMKRTTPKSKKDGVKLMTTHSSKGLEFDVVIVTGCATQINSDKMVHNIFIDKEFGICPKFTDTSIGYKTSTVELTAHSRNQSLQNKAEEMRILYVAATRAKKLLFLTATTDKQDEISKIFTEECGSYEITKSSSYFGWIKYAADMCGDENIMDINIVTPYSDGHTPKKKERTDIFSDLPVNTQTEERIRENFGYSYPYHSSMIPSKLSVSALKDNSSLISADKLIERKSIRESFYDREKSKKAAKKGTLIHRILEEICRDDVLTLGTDGAVDAVISSKKITDDEITSYDRKMLREFFASDIGNKMLLSDSLHREQPFILREKANIVNKNWEQSNDEILIQGIIDCWFEYDGEVYLVDFKTDRIKNEEHLRELNEKYSVQLSYYKTALENSLGRNVDHSYICYLRKNIAVKA